MFVNVKENGRSLMKNAFVCIWIIVWISSMVLIEGLNIRPGTYMPLNESDRGKNLNLIQTFSSRIREMHRKGGQLTMILGFSTGHVGTTTLTSKSAYNVEEVNANKIKFVFERAGVPPSTCGRRDWDLKKEMQHVEYYYGPEILTNVSMVSKSTIVDLSHANLCFYRGLVHVLHQANVPFKFVRIRRERIETALSMSIQNNSVVDFFERDYYRYHPFEAAHQVHLRIPGGNKTWNNFTSTQRIFWVVDETQARWEALLAHHPDLPHVSIYWSKEADNLSSGVAAIARALGIQVSKRGIPTTKVHAGDKTADFTLRTRAMQLDAAYRAIMGFNLTDSELSNFQNQHLIVASKSKKYLYNRAISRQQSP